MPCDGWVRRGKRDSGNLAAGHLLRGRAYRDRGHGALDCRRSNRRLRRCRPSKLRETAPRNRRAFQKNRWRNEEGLRVTRRTRDSGKA